MSQQVYYPYQLFGASKNRCFLTGKPITSPEEQIHVFPQWLMSRYGLQDKPLKLLDESVVTYKDLKLPCAADTNEFYIEPLEQEIAAAFERGYQAVKQLDELRLFQWVSKWMHGIIFNELYTARLQEQASGNEFSVSQSILQRFINLHLMLQTLNLDIEFEEGFKPYSLFVVKVDNAENEFSYRDEVSTLTFSLRVNDFGLIFCLQDNGTISRYQEQVFEQIRDQVLHPIQYEEFSARVFYSTYLFNRLPNYDVMTVGDTIYLEPHPLRGTSAKPIFDAWDEKTYGQVLENFWKKWGFLLFEIMRDPDHPMSFLFDTDGTFKPAASIDLAK